MADTLTRTEQIWMFGKKYDFNVYQSSVALDTFQYRINSGTPERQQKNQIVLHFTAGNGPGQGSIEWWNEIATRENWLCPQRYTGAHHKWGYAHRLQCPHNNTGTPPHLWEADTGTCPVHGQAAVVTCPSGHGPVVKGGKQWASAHYIVEQKENRLNAGQAYSDVIEVVPSDHVTFHGEAVNPNSIGIEHANAGNDWSAARYDAFTGTGAAKRPTDRNRWLHLPNPGFPNCNLDNLNTDFQAYQDEQYLAMILLLRHLCIKHRIARRFLGDTTSEKMQRWWHNLPASSQALTRSKLMRFRGILSHMNCHATKTCGGPALQRNRLFRGIIDEWWLPVEVKGEERPYYMGPFDPQNNSPSYFRWTAGAAAPLAELFHDANLDALQDTKSYFDLDHVEWYCALTETLKPGGTYPIGTNKMWHGGLHLEPPDSNRKAYAAASGTIVAARLGSDKDVEKDPEYGSQRFVLIRHCVYLEQETDPSGKAGDKRLNYTATPIYIFTLYMHLAAFADLAAVNNANPPWFNYWRRRNTSADATKVFCPNVEVAVGDWLGSCGTFRDRQMIHFEVVSREELKMKPWDDPKYRAYDDNEDQLCDAPEIDKFVLTTEKQGLTTLDILRAAKDLRLVKSYHKSEWALANADALKPLIKNDKAREAKWEKLKHFMWVADAVAACPDLTTQLCDAKGMMWFYHPLKFMEVVNRLILEENREVSEPTAVNTNVILEDGYLTQFVRFTSGSPVTAQADAAKVQPFDVSSNLFEYHFTRKEIACLATGAHSPGPTPPTETKFHLSLLDVIESIREQYASSMSVKLSYLCSGHNVAANQNLCVVGSADGLNKHAAGHAVDIKPGSATPAKCRSLWTAAKAAVTSSNAAFGEHGGEPSRPDLPEGCSGIQIVMTPQIQKKLEAGTPLTNAEAAAFAIHIEMIEGTPKVVWECWLRKTSKAKSVRTVDYDDLASGNTFRGIKAVYSAQADAKAEAESGSGSPTQNGSDWECWLRKNSYALEVRIQGTGIVGSYVTLDMAESAKEANTEPAWPKET
jgi:hypothetical protein